MDIVRRLPVEAESRWAPLHLHWLGRGGRDLLEGALAGALKRAGRVAGCWRRILPVGVAVVVAFGPSHFVRGLVEGGAASGSSSLEVTALVKPGGKGAVHPWCRPAPGLPGGEPAGTHQYVRSLDHRWQRRIGAWQVVRPVAAWPGGLPDRGWPTHQGIGAGVRGLAGVPGAPRAACRVGRGWRGMRGAARPTLLAWHARILLPALACLEWVPAAAGLPHGSCMVSATVGGVHSRGAALDGGTPIGPGIPVIVAAPGAWDGAGRLGSIFRGIAEPPGVMIHLNRHREGVADLAARTCVVGGAGGGQLSSGDRGSLPGRSTRYRVIWLVCAQCGTKVPCLFYDECDIPICVNTSHGPMEMSR